MEYLLVVYFLMNGDWVRGDDIEPQGWASIAYTTEEMCLERKARAEEIYVDLKRVNPRVYEKRYTCDLREGGADG